MQRRIRRALAKARSLNLTHHNRAALRKIAADYGVRERNLRRVLTHDVRRKAERERIDNLRKKREKAEGEEAAKRAGARAAMAHDLGLDEVSRG